MRHIGKKERDVLLWHPTFLGLSLLITRLGRSCCSRWNFRVNNYYFILTLSEGSYASKELGISNLKVVVQQILWTTTSELIRQSLPFLLWWHLMLILKKMYVSKYYKRWQPDDVSLSNVFITSCSFLYPRPILGPSSSMVQDTCLKP